MDSILGLLMQHLPASGQRIAIEHGNLHMTYEELAEAANQAADQLRQQGVGKGTFVGLFLERGSELVVQILGCLKVGAVFIPLDPTFPDGRLEQMLSVARPVLLVTMANEQVRLLQMTRNLKMEQVTIVLAGTGVQNLDQLTPCISAPDDPCYMFFTSGSTGIPKGILGCHKGLVHFIQWEIETFGVSCTDRVSHFTTPSFDAMLRDLFVPLVAGATICIPEETEIILDSARLVHWIAEKRITLVHCVPSLFRRLLAEVQSGEQFPELRYILLAGERVLPADVDRWLDLFGERIRLVNLYGASETTMVKVYHLITREDRNRTVIPVGKPMKGAKVILLDQDRNICPPGVVGEIYIRTPYMTLGYYNDPVKTREVFLPNPFSSKPGDQIYKTGDLGRTLPDGNLEFIGRSDQQVKIRGVRVELGEIEAALASHPSIKEVAVSVYVNEEGENVPVAYLVRRECEGNAKSASDISETVEPGITTIQADFRKYLQHRLPVYMIPGQFICLEKMPLTPTGKIDRNALPKPGAAEVTSPGTFVAPRSGLEQGLARIYQEVLRKERIGLNDNFFLSGGHSLNATRVISRIYQQMQVQIPLRQFFQNPTVAELAELVQELQQTRGDAQVSAILPQPKQPYYPVSHGQRRLWILSRMGGLSSAYNLSSACILEGQLNLPAFENAFREIVLRHEILRTYFTICDDEPVQVVDDGYEFALEYISEPEYQLYLKNNTAGIPENRLGIPVESINQEFINADAAKPFDLSKPGLFRASLTALTAERHLFLFTMHHIIADGWSFNVLIRELCAYYNAQMTGEDPGLPELGIQYRDYAVWQDEQSRNRRLAEQREYWHEHLGGEIPVLHLPTDEPRPVVQNYSGERRPFLLNAGVQQGLQELAAERGTTLFALLFAAYNLLLSRYSGQEEIIVGIPVHGRSAPELEGLIGFFVNTLAVKTRITGGSFVELLNTVQQDLLAAFDHQDYPFDQLVEELHIPRDPGRSPVFDTMFALQNTPELIDQTLSLGDLQLRPVTQERKTSRFDLTLTLVETAAGLAGSLEYSTALFHSETVERFVSHYAQLLESIVANPTEDVRKVSLLSSTEKAQLLQFATGAQVDYPGPHCLHLLVEHWVAEQAQAVAVISGNEQLTYGELGTAANQLAEELVLLGVRVETPVALLFERSSILIISMLAVLKAGGVYVPISADYPPERIGTILQDSGAPVLLTSAQWMSKINPDYAGMVLTFVPERKEFSVRVTSSGLKKPEERVFRISADNQSCQYAKRSDLLPTVKPDHLAYIIYTSGSTGHPKGVMVEHRSIVNTIQWKLRLYPYTSGDRILQLVSVAFDGAQSDIWVALGGGLTLVLPDLTGGFEPAKLISEIQYHQIHHFLIIPTLYMNLLTELQNQPLQSVKTITVGGEQATEALWHLHRTGQSHIQLCNEYGPTEAAVNCTYFPTVSGDMYQGAIPIGKPIDNMQVYILNEAFELQPIGVPGEIYISGTGVARGYVNRPDLTADRFIPDPFRSGQSMYKSGDLARYLSDGSIQYIGRSDSQVKIRGYRIELGEIEAAFRQCASVEDVLVLALETPQRENFLAAYVIPKMEEIASVARQLEEELHQQLRSVLPVYMIPGVIHILKEFPLTLTGKVDRKALSLYQTVPREADNQPQTELESVLVRIWSQVLGVQQIRREDNFFALGGHSLRATQVITRISQELGLDCSMEAFFTAPTIAGLAAYLSNQQQMQYRELPQGESQASESVSPEQKRCWIDSFVENPVAAQEAVFANRSNDASREQTLHPCLVKLRSGSSQTNLFCIHPGGGGVMMYLELARQLHPSCTIYGIQARGLSTEEPLPATLEEMVEDYIAAIKRVQPVGSYQLLGHSLGGSIACAIASKLEASGAAVSTLLLLDTHSFDDFRHVPPVEMQIKAMILTELQQFGITIAQDIETQSLTEIIATYFTPANLKNTPYNNLQNQEILHLYAVRQNILKLLRVPATTIRADLTIFQAKESRHRKNLATSWKKWTNGRVTLEEVPGNHYSMLDGQNVQVLAETINKRVRFA